MSVTDAHGCTTLRCPTYQLGSYRASTLVTPMRSADLQVADLKREITGLKALRNQVTHALSLLFVSHSQAAFTGEQPDFFTLVLPAREPLPNDYELGGAAATLVTGTSSNFPTIGEVVNAIPSPEQTTCALLADSLTPCGLLTPSSDATQQLISVYSPTNACPLFTWGAPQGSNTSPTESVIHATAPVESCDADNELTTFVEIRLDRAPGLRTQLLRHIKRRYARIGRRLRRWRITGAPRPRSARRNSTLATLAVSRRYGRRGESDDHTLPAHRWTSVICGEPALSC